MKAIYRPRLNGVWHPTIKSGNPGGAWKALQHERHEGREKLRAAGWRVKLDVDVEESDIQVAADVVETVAPKPVGKIVGFFRRIFGG